MKLKPLLTCLMPAAILVGCTSSIKPVVTPLVSPLPATSNCSQAVTSAANSNDVNYPKYRLAYLVCESHKTAASNLNQSQAWANRAEWRDIPLLGAAATVAGLVLFGKRDASNALTKGEQEAISGIGFGAAAFATFANYLSPQKARELLRQSARGHFCLATQGELILAVYSSIKPIADRNELRALAASLAGELENKEQKVDNEAEVRAIYDAAITAIALYDRQYNQLSTAGIALGESSWNFGIDLLTRSDRGPQQVDSLVQVITDQTASVAKFANTEAKATNPVPSAVIRNSLANPKVLAPAPLGSMQLVARDSEAIVVANKTALLLDGLVNIEALVLGFDKCAETALAGGTPKADRIQRITLP